MCGHNTFMNRLHVRYLTLMANWSSTVSVARVDRKASFVCLDFDIRGFPLWGSHIGRFFTQMGRASNAAREKTGSTLGNGKVCTQFLRSWFLSATKSHFIYASLRSLYRLMSASPAIAHLVRAPAQLGRPKAHQMPGCLAVSQVRLQAKRADQR